MKFFLLFANNAETGIRQEMVKALSSFVEGDEGSYLSYLYCFGIS